MTQKSTDETRRRKSITGQERQDRFQATHDLAMAAIEAEKDARRRKSERLKAAREAAARPRAD